MKNAVFPSGLREKKETRQSEYGKEKMMKGCTQASEDRNVEGMEDEDGRQKHENNKRLQRLCEG